MADQIYQEGEKDASSQKKQSSSTLTLSKRNDQNQDIGLASSQTTEISKQDSSTSLNGSSLYGQGKRRQNQKQED